MKSTKEEFIGNGAHWYVKRLSTTENGVTKSVIQKEPVSETNIQKNITNYELIKSSGLPTLLKYSQKNYNGIGIIEAEDLNPEKSDGLYVSPNTVKNSPNCASIIADLLNPLTKFKSASIECKELNLEEYIQHPDKILEDIDRLSKRRILKGAEKTVYEKKIKEISNFKQFLIQSEDDMKKAADNHLELFSDAFFFRVTDSNNQIGYKIADFDCITSHRINNVNVDELVKVNKSYFEDSLYEFIEFFIEESKQIVYISVIKNTW